MFTITANDPDHALVEGIRLLERHGYREESRVGPVIVAPNSVATVYLSPTNRVSTSALRDANPFFHLTEALWMLGGRNDVALPAYYAPRLATFSDDGKTLHGAYGFRWREYFGIDQLDLVIKELTRNRATRRCVLAMWDSGSADDGVNHGDLVTAMAGGKDVPCNTHAYFMVRAGKLDMTVCCRSNDIVWGAYGANVVHFSMLLEYVALSVGFQIGTYTQFSNNYHAYIERPDTLRLFEASHESPPAPTRATWVPLFSEPRERVTFDHELSLFLNDDGTALARVYHNQFLRRVALPMKEAFALYKKSNMLLQAAFGPKEVLAEYEKNIASAILKLAKTGIDWHEAGIAWLDRRLTSRRIKAEEVRPA